MPTCSRQKMPGCSWGRLSEARGVWGAGNLEGGGLGRGWVKGGQFSSNLGARRTDPVTARRVPSKWKKVERGVKGEQKGLAKRKRQGGMRSKGNEPCTLQYMFVYIYRMPETFEWYLSCTYIIIIIRMNVDDNLNSVYVINKPCMSSRNICLLPRPTLRRDREHHLWKPPR